MSKGQVLAHAKSRTAPQTPTETRRSVRQEVFEKARHGHLVLFIGAHFRGVLRLRKAVRRAAVEIDLEVHLGGAELRDHGINLLHRRYRIFSAVQDENATFNVLGGLRRDAEDTYHARKRTQIDGLLLKLLDASANPSQVSPALFAAFGESLRTIMNDKDPTVSKLARKSRCLHRVAEGAYYVSLLAFAIGVAAVWWVMWQCPRPIP